MMFGKLTPVEQNQRTYAVPNHEDYSLLFIEKMLYKYYDKAIFLKGRCNMDLSNEIKIIRQHAFLTQESFAKELRIAFSTVNR